MTAPKAAVFLVRNVRTGDVLVETDLQSAKTPYDEDGSMNKESVPQSSHTEAMNDILALLTAAQRESYAFFGRFMQAGNGTAGVGDDGSHNDEDGDADSEKLQSSEWSVDNARDDNHNNRPKRTRTE